MIFASSLLVIMSIYSKTRTKPDVFLLERCQFSFEEGDYKRFEEANHFKLDNQLTGLKRNCSVYTVHG
jgi:hypothetical protein